jgi:Uma2 family endonuclease
MALQETLLSIHDLRQFEARPENQDRLFELIDGRIIEKMPASFLPAQVAATLIVKIGNYLAETPIGYVTGADGGYIMNDEGRKFIPDVAYISKERLPEIPEREAPVPPDLAVEVISPTDKVKVTQQKARMYLEAGTQLVWIVYPDDALIDVCTLADDGDLKLHTLSADDILTGGDVLPNFNVPVNAIFPQ